MIALPIEIGDTILAGRFKNKKITVKEIGVDEHGLPTINGRGILKIRIAKLMKPKIEETTVARKINQKEYQYYIFKDDAIWEGFEYKEDAIDRKNEMGDQRVKVFSKTYLKTKLNIDPDDNSSWGKQTMKSKVNKIKESTDSINIGKMKPCRIKKEDGKFWIYRVNQGDNSEVCASNTGYESKQAAERAAQWKGYVMVDEKGEIQEYEHAKLPVANDARSDGYKPKQTKIEYIEEIVRKIVQESAIRGRNKKKLNEVDVTDSKIEKAIEELSELEQQLANAEAQITELKKKLGVADLEKKYKQVVDTQLWDFLEQLKKDDERVVRTKNVLLNIKRFQTEKATYEYEKVLDFAMTQVNQDVKEKILMELKAVEKISRVKPSLAFSKRSESKLNEANIFTKILDWMSNFFTGLNAKLKLKGQKIDTNLDKLEQMIQGQ